MCNYDVTVVAHNNRQQLHYCISIPSNNPLAKLYNTGKRGSGTGLSLTVVPAVADMSLAPRADRRVALAPVLASLVRRGVGTFINRLQIVAIVVLAVKYAVVDFRPTLQHNIRGIFTTTPQNVTDS